MRHSSSTSTTIQDLENAMKFLNKELTVEDIENIYGDFNDPAFQSALREVKGNLDNITRAINLRSLTLLKNAMMGYKYMINQALGVSIMSLRTIQRRINASKARMGKYEKQLEEYKSFNELLDSAILVKNAGKMTEELEDRLVNLIHDMDDSGYLTKYMELTTKHMQVTNNLIKEQLRYGKLDVKRKDLLKVRKQLDEKIQTVDKQIYTTQMQTLVNVMQDMFTMVLDNLYY